MSTVEPVQTLIALARREQRNALDEQTAKQVLAHFGIAVPRSGLVRPGESVVDVLGSLTPPYVVKIVSPDVVHKSDVGGVKVDLKSIEAVEQAIAEMARHPAIASARVAGYLVEEMAPRGTEVVVGGMHDANFGPIVMVGLGGIFVELLKDVSFRICPIDRFDAQEMIGELKGHALLKGARGTAPACTEAIVEALLKIGGEAGLLVQHHDFKEVDINPLIVSAHGAVAADARLILR